MHVRKFMKYLLDTDISVAYVDNSYAAYNFFDVVLVKEGLKLTFQICLSVSNERMFVLVGDESKVKLNTVIKNFSEVYRISGRISKEVVEELLTYLFEYIVFKNSLIQIQKS